jgi:hypothetical protein
VPYALSFLLLRFSASQLLSSDLCLLVVDAGFGFLL